MHSRILATMGLSGLAFAVVTAGAALSQSGGIPIVDSVNLSALHLASTEDPVDSKPIRKTGPAYQQEKVKEWRVLAAQHESGKPDAAAVTMGKWEKQDIQIVVDYVIKLVSKSKSAIRRELSKARIQRLFDLNDQEAQQGDLNRVLRRGVILHTDVALLDLGKWDDRPLLEGMGANADGHAVPIPPVINWEFARLLIECVPKSSSQDPMVRQWYIATTAYMESRRLLGYAGPNLQSALKRFPSDAKLLFYAGVLHETWASPLNQNFVLPKGGSVSFKSRVPELKLAREHYEKAIASDPTFAEARLRLGRVLGMLGHHDKALVELQQASASLKDSLLLYYASLYLGTELGALSRRSEARSQYERASMLYPNAQAPLLALSELAHSEGDAEGALLAIQRVFELPRKNLWEDDPWWMYDVSHARDAQLLLEKLGMIMGGPSQ